MDRPRADLIKIVLYSASLYFHTHPLEDFYIIRDQADASFLFSLQKDFYIAHKHIGPFSLLFLQKDFGTFHKSFFESFSLFFFITVQLFVILIYRKKENK